MYVCGPTVYDFAHVGNARPVVVFDVLYRLLRRIYGAGNVTYVRNITDVDDKINAAAKSSGEPISALTARTTEAFHKDMAALGTLPPDVEPRATDHIPEMIALIEALLARGHAYVADGHVLFEVASMPDYGRLSGRNRDELIAGARVEVAPYKRDPADFVLWKPSEADLPGWPSPWGRGRPGWHLECSAMSAKHLGESFDIHGGGRDLVFPHHENERAQSLCASDGASFARYWVHNGFLSVEGEKMSKSLGNILTVRELLAAWPGEAIRLNLLSAHYRQPLDWTEDSLRRARKALDRWYRALQMCAAVGAVRPEGDDPGVSAFVEALEDDLNTPLAIRELHRQVDLVFGSRATTEPARGAADLGKLKGRLLFMGDLLGLLGQDPEAWFKGRTVEGGAGPGTDAETQASVAAVGDEERIEERIAEREKARKAKDFGTADRIRDELAAEGVILEDGPAGTTWRRAG